MSGGVRPRQFGGVRHTRTDVLRIAIVFASGDKLVRAMAAHFANNSHQRVVSTEELTYELG